MNLRTFKDSSGNLLVPVEINAPSFTSYHANEAPWNQRVRRWHRSANKGVEGCDAESS